MISVIIPGFVDGKYLLRCLNSLKRQSFTDFETIILNEDCPENIVSGYRLKHIGYKNCLSDFCDALNMAVNAAQGEYIYFLDADSVISPNMFDALLSAEEDTFTYAQQYTVDEKETKKTDDILFSCFGKLLKKSRIEERNILFKGNGTVSELLFMAQYLNGFEKFKEAGCYIYSDAPTALSREVSIDAKVWAEIISILKNSSGIIHDKTYAYIKVLSAQPGFCSDEIMFLIESELHGDYELNFSIAVPVLKELWREIREEKDASAFESFKNYLSKYEGEPIYGMLLRVLAIDSVSYKYFAAENEICNALFLYEQDIRLKGHEATVPKASAAPQPALKKFSGNEDFSMVKINGKWRCYINGVISQNFTGLAKNQYGWWYFKNGDFIRNYNGFAPKTDGWYEIKDGKAIRKIDSDEIARAAEETVRRELAIEQATELKELIEAIGADMRTQKQLEAASGILEKLQALLGRATEMTIYKPESKESEPITPENVISTYGEGRLGFRTITKSIWAWIKYKAGRKGR